ncbi:MAG: transporter, family, tetracycline resistance protein [Sphingomonadales bacterium]|jgi:DHA1 family tetracycline resistance protein-like MFS transporter|nr:transporter, family, tetracycline resistance protein [Sphingomonadales bacterium]
MRFHHRAVPIVLVALLVDAIGFGIVLPVLPGLIVHLAHVTVPQATRIAGYMLVAYAGAQFFAGPVLGNLGDRFGRRPVLLFSMIAFSLDYGLMAAAPTIGWLFVGRFIAGIAGASYTPANAVLADVTAPEKRGGVFGLMGAAFGLGFILGPALGGLLAAFGTRAPFMAAAGLAGLNALWIALALPETLPPEQRRSFDWRQANVLGSFRPLLHAGGAAPLLAAALLWQLGHIVYPATWAFWAELALGWDAPRIGWSLAAAGLGMALAQALVTGRAIARFGEERTVVIGMLVGGASFLAYVFVRQPGFVYLIIFASALQGLAWPSLNALLSRMTDASHQGALQGGMASIASIAAIVGPLAMTQALAFGAERGQPGGAFLLAALLAFSALILVWFGVVRRLRRVAVAA